MKPLAPFCLLAPFLLTIAALVGLAHSSLSQPALPPAPLLSPAQQERLIEGARQPLLPPWQREFMMRLAQGERGQRVSPSGPLDALPARITSDPSVDGTWQFLPSSGPFGHTAFYDPVRDRMVVFGGYDGSSFKNDVRALSLAGSPAWTELLPVGMPPSGRVEHAAIYDPVRDRMIVFGGFDGSSRNDVWALSLAGRPAWTELAPAGMYISRRYGHTAIFDPVRDRMVVFGGCSEYGLENDVYALSLGESPSWTQLAPTGTPPAARCYQAAVYDPVRDRMVVFGGHDGYSLRNDVWALSLAGGPSWTELLPGGTPPIARYEHTAVYDPVGDRMVVIGGYGGSLYKNDVWVLSLAGSPSWAELQPGGAPPSARYSHTAIYDPVHDRMVVHGGYDGSYHDDLWALSLAESPSWTELLPTGTPPSARYLHTAFYEPVHDRVVVFGGFDVTYRNDLGALSLPGGPSWVELTAAGTPPSARGNHTAIYDPVRNRMVVFGGNGGSSLENDVWALSLGDSPAWTELLPTGTPPSARYVHTAFYDPVRDRMMVFGGWDGARRNDVWALSLAGSPSWTELFPSGTPPSGRYGHTAIYDPVRDRMIVFGGSDDSSYKNDVWALSLAESPSWAELLPSGTPPSARYCSTAFYDPVRDRVVVFGGYGGSYRNDAWALSLTESPSWTELLPGGTPPSARYCHTALYDPAHDRMVVFGGYDGAPKNDVWALVWGTPPLSVPDVDAPLAARFEFAPPRPTPSRGAVTFDFALPRAAAISIVVCDVAGRAIANVADGSFAPGRHSVVWNRRDEAGNAAQSGVYFVRFQAPGVRVTRKAVLIQ